MKIVLTTFAKARHFDANAAGTIISDRTPKQFESEVNALGRFPLADGYDPFCKMLIAPNWTSARTGAIEITPENRMHLQSGYKARHTKELAVLSRWFVGVEVPKATHLCIVLYDKAQLAKEETKIDGDYGIVAILGQMNDKEQPMPPITAMRNALGTEQGGSGKALDSATYQESVAFWETHAVVKIAAHKYVLYDDKLTRIASLPTPEMLRSVLAGRAALKGCKATENMTLARWNSQGRTEEWKDEKWVRRKKIPRPVDIARVINSKTEA